MQNCSFYIFVSDVAGYVAEIYETLVTTPRQELKLLEEELKQNVPEPLHSMLEKETKEEAIEKHKARKQKETVICGPTCTGEGLGVILKIQTSISSNKEVILFFNSFKMVKFS